VKLKDGSLVWGRMVVFPHGIELLYSRPFRSRGGFTNTSYIMFSNEMESIQAIYRFHTELSPANQIRRKLKVKRTANPGILRRFARHMRNFINTFRDAINESMGLLLNRMKGSTSSVLFKTQDERLKKVGSSALGAVGNAYDAILERYIGRRIVLELQPDDGEREEYCGVLQEYSPDWIAILDCRIVEERKLPLADTARLRLQRDMDFWMTLEHSEAALNGISLRLRVENHANEPIRIRRLEAEGYSHKLAISLSSGESHEWILDDLPATSLGGIDRLQLPIEAAMIGPERKNVPAPQNPEIMDNDLFELPDIELVFDSMREVDVYVPRSIGTLRHGNETTDKRSWSW
jgi:hypothetical protein